MDYIFYSYSTSKRDIKIKFNDTQKGKTLILKLQSLARDYCWEEEFQIPENTQNT